METYHKINAPFKRDMTGEITGQKGKLIIGDWARPEFEYLADNEWRYSVKMDGTNIRVELHKGFDFYSAEYGGRSDNAVIPKPLLSYLEATFPTYPSWRRDIQAPSYYDRYKEVYEWMGVFTQGEKVVLFGEGYGPKIQGGGKYRDDHSFILFDVRVGDFWLSRENVVDVGVKLGIDVVPEVGRGSLYEAIELVTGGLRSQFGDFYEEGLVCRPVVDLFNRKGERIITKVKHVDLHSQ